MAAVIVWFKRDLRLADHRPLAAAMEAARAPGLDLIPLYIVEPDLWSQPDAAGRHWEFLREGLVELDVALRARGSALVLRHGTAEAVLAELSARHGTTGLFSHQETGNRWSFGRDRRVAAWARDAGISWIEFRQFGVFRALPSRDGWAGRWEREMAIPETPTPDAIPPLPYDIDPGTIPREPPAPCLDAPCRGRQAGGRAAGLKLLHDFLAGRAAGYGRAMSSPLSAETGCSRLSAHLAWGTLSLREIVRAVRRRRAALADDPRAGPPGLARDLAAFDARLHWHCHFIQKLESEPALEQRCLHPAFEGLRDESWRPEIFAAWAQGRTGFPMADACMRMLAATGWLNFRMRAMLVSLASHQLGLHWREPALHLARLFTDYEPGIHYPQIQMQAGTTGVNTPRLYNPVKQGLDHDPKAIFLRRWLPELAHLPTPALHHPWTVTISERNGYPDPVVALGPATQEARARLTLARRKAGFGDAADAIQNRHGSRRSGLKATGGVRERRAAEKAAVSRAQLSLDL